MSARNGRDERVGYGSPPKHSRFKKGRSGNPKGRPPNSRNFDSLLNEELEQKISVTERGATRRITKREAIAKRLVDMQLGSGGQLTFGVYGKSVVGRGADIIIVDDPLSPSEANDDRPRAEANEWFKSDLLPRLTERSRGAILVVMQRLHPDDLTGMLLHGDDSWKHVAYQSVAAADEHWTLPNGEMFVRRKGEALHPAVLNREQLLDILHQIGAVQFSAQYQQDPSIRQEQRRGQWLVKHYDQDWYDNWTPEDGLERWFLGYVPEVWFLRYQLFGEGPPPPERYVAKLGVEKWEQALRLQQRRLLESTLGPDYRHPSEKSA
jgi:hypothetical protein